MLFKIRVFSRDLTDEKILRDIRKTAKFLKKAAINAFEYDKRGIIRSAAVIQRFGSWNKALIAAGMKPIDRRAEAVENLVNDIKAVSKKLGKTSFSCYEYERNGKYNYAMVKRYFSKWSDALKAAGLKYIKRRPPTKVQLLENLVEVWLKLGRQPSIKELKKPLSKIGKNEYPKFFGSWTKALEEMVKFIKKSGYGSVELHYRMKEVKKQPVKTQARRDKANKNLKKIIHKTSRGISYRMRNFILERDSYICRACGASPAKGDNTKLQIDHIIPWAKGGESTPDNLQTLCFECNIGKSNSFSKRKSSGKSNPPGKRISL